MIGHDGALEQLIAFVREQLGNLRLAGVGHRVQSLIEGARFSIVQRL
jgi:hypothetical protein